jgi:hypothetical protein
MEFQEFKDAYEFHIVSKDEIKKLREESDPSYIIIKDGETFECAKVSSGFNVHIDHNACIECIKRMMSIPSAYGGCDKVYYQAAGIENFPFIERGVEILGQHSTLVVIKCKELSKNN